MMGQEKRGRTPMAPSPTQPFTEVGENEDGEKLLKLVKALAPFLLCKEVVVFGVVGGIGFEGDGIEGLDRLGHDGGSREHGTRRQVAGNRSDSLGCGAPAVTSSGGTSCRAQSHRHATVGTPRRVGERRPASSALPPPLSDTLLPL